MLLVLVSEFPRRLILANLIALLCGSMTSWQNSSRPPAGKEIRTNEGDEVLNGKFPIG